MLNLNATFRTTVAVAEVAANQKRDQVFHSQPHKSTAAIWVGLWLGVELQPRVSGWQRAPLEAKPLQGRN